MIDFHYFHNLWYPDFIGVSYITTSSGFLIAPCFSEHGKAVYVSKKIEMWNEKFINVTFITLNDGTYEFVCYEKPIAAKNPITFGLYRSSMQQDGIFSKVRHKLQEKCKLQIIHIKNMNILNDMKIVGDAIKINKIEIVPEEDLPHIDIQSGISLDTRYYHESTAHRSLDKKQL